MLSLKQLQAAAKVGGFVSVTFGLSLKIHCRIKDVRERFGRVDVLITPVNGTGEKWVSHDRISPIA